MAIFIGSVRDKKATAGEKAVAEIFKQLDDECVIYSQPQLCGCFPDFVAIIPDIGVFIVEVKDLKAGSVIYVDNKLFLQSEDGDKEIRHPKQQVELYEKFLRDGLTQSKFAHVVRGNGGSHKDELAFPAGSLVFFTQIEDLDLNACGIGRDDICKRIITRTRLGALKSDVNALREAFRAGYSGWRPFAGMNENQIAVVRSVISPRCAIGDDGLRLKILDIEQEKILDERFGGHRLIYGPAGTGKTVVLLARARSLAADQSQRILVLCFNAPLRHWLANKLADLPNVQVLTFNRWGGRHRIGFEDHGTKAEYGVAFLDALRNGNGDTGRFDAVFIDECQIFEKEWFECALLALKDRKEGDLFIAGDNSQALTRSRKFTWKSLGINVQGRTTILKKVYRCPKPIYEASLIALKNRPEYIGEALLEEYVVRGTARREGPEPHLIRTKNRIEEARLAAALIESWLLGGFAYRGRRRAVWPQDIAILYPFRGGDLAEPFRLLVSRLSEFWPVSVLAREGGNGSITDQNMKIIPIQRSKGLQFTHVITLWTDLLPRCRFDATGGDANTWLHVAMTRSEFSLTMLYSGNWDLLSEIHDHLYPGF
jgi:Nuclease-related domain/AAA domain